MRTTLFFLPHLSSFPQSLDQATNYKEGDKSSVLPYHFCLRIQHLEIWLQRIKSPRHRKEKQRASMFPKRNTQAPTGKYDSDLSTKERGELKTQGMTKKRQPLSWALASEQDSGGFRGAVLCSWRTECARNIRSQRVVNRVTFQKNAPNHFTPPKTSLIPGECIY